MDFVAISVESNQDQFGKNQWNVSIISLVEISENLLLGMLSGE